MERSQLESDKQELEMKLNSTKCELELQNSKYKELGMVTIVYNMI